MKKAILAGFLSIAFLASSPILTDAKVQRVPGQTTIQTWDLKGTYTLDFTCTQGCSGDHFHTMTIDKTEGKSFSGTGFSNENSNITWNVVGQLVDSSLKFDIIYTASGSNYKVFSQGQIDNDGDLLGTATSSSGESFTWKTTQGKALPITITTTYKNHGQYVKSQEKGKRKEAAHSRIGMPVKSKGHTQQPQGNQNGK